MTLTRTCPKRPLPEGAGRTLRTAVHAHGENEYNFEEIPLDPEFPRFRIAVCILDGYFGGGAILGSSTHPGRQENAWAMEDAVIFEREHTEMYVLAENELTVLG